MKAMIEVSCRVCSKIFPIKVWRLKRKDQRFCCSRSCSASLGGRERQGPTRQCRICGELFYVYPSRVNRRYCSKKCCDLDKIGKPPPNKGVKGLQGANAGSFKTGNNIGPNHPLWKGDDCGYVALHNWVKRHRGPAVKCTFCGSMKRVQWANRSNKYLRDLNDWITLCQVCHAKYDGRTGNPKPPSSKIKERFHA